METKFTKNIGRGKHRVQPPQNGHGQDHLAVVRLLVVAAQHVSHLPDEIYFFLKGFHAVAGNGARCWRQTAVLNRAGLLGKDYLQALLAGNCVAT